MDARSSYLETAVRGASPVQLVILLYEQAVADLRRAIVALEKGDIEARTREINHALVLIGQLHGSLDMERGGEVATNLQTFYNMVRVNLTEAQAKQSAGILEEQISHLVLLCDAWLEVERATSGREPRSTEPAPAASRKIRPKTIPSLIGAPDAFDAELARPESSRKQSSTLLLAGQSSSISPAPTGHGRANDGTVVGVDASRRVVAKLASGQESRARP